MNPRIPAIADYLANALEITGDPEALVYLMTEFGLERSQAERLVDLGRRIMLDPTQMDVELYARISAVLREAV